MTQRFANKAVLVTGAASGIGRASAMAFGAEGARVLVVDRDAAGADAVAAALRAAGSEAEAFAADIADRAACKAMVAHAVVRFGGLHVAVNNAGIPGSMTKRVDEYDDAEWDGMIAVNLTGAFNCIRAEVPALLATGRGGAIVNTASIAGLVAAPTMSSYVAAKHGLVGLTKGAALDLIPLGIRVNCVCPGAVHTAMLEPAMAIPGLREMIARNHPIGRAAEADEIARAILFLASDEASYIVGHALAIDGGVVVQ